MSNNTQRVILDTNFWISFLLTGNYARLDKLLLAQTVVLLFSQELLDEFLRVARRPKFRKYFAPDDVDDLLETIDEHAQFITVTTAVTLCRDVKDNFLLALALDGKATHLITDDKDLLELRAIGESRILTMTEFENSGS